MKAILSFCLFLILAWGPATAATLDFTGFPKGENPSPLVIPKVAIIENVNGALFVYGQNDFGIPGTGGVCALQSDFSCIGGLSLLFNGSVSNLSFKGFFATSTDVATITVYSGNTALGFQLVSGNQSGQIDVDFTGLTGITKVDITTAALGSGKGIAYGEFNYDPDPPNTPPPPPPPTDTLSFDALPKGVNTGSLDIGYATISQPGGGDLFVYHTGDFYVPANGAVCAMSSGFTCMGDLLVQFDGPILDLMFSAFFAKQTDSMIISLFNGTSLVFSGQFWGSTGGTILFDFRKWGLLTSILIEDASDAATKGAAYGDFKFTIVDEPAPVPLPPSVVLLALALLSLALPMRRRHARVSVE